jgi:hypothetical protein
MKNCKYTTIPFMKKYVLYKSSLILILLNLSAIIHAQLTMDWALPQGSNDSDLTGGARIDDQGSIYFTANYRDTIDLDPGPGVNMAFVAEDEPFVLNKYTQQGEYLWSGQFTTTGDAYGFMSEIKNNRILMIMYYTDSLFYSHDNPWMIANPGKHLALITMNLDGQIISHQHLSNNLDMYFSDFITQPDGSYLADGGFEGSVTFVTTDSTKTIHSAGSTDAFVARFNDQGQLEWITMFAGTGYDYLESIKVSKNDLIYYAMIHDSTVTLPTNLGQVTSPAYGQDNAIFGWMTQEGAIGTAYLFGGDLGDQLRNIDVDEAGNMFISGYFEGTVNFEHPSETPVVFTSANNGDGFVSKYTPQGKLVWARVFRTGDYGGVYTMSLHRNSDIYLAGGYTHISDLDPGPDSIIVDGGSRSDVFVGKLDTDGNLDWVYSITGSSWTGVRSFLPGTNGNAFLLGSFFADVECDPGPDSTQFISQGGSDIYLIGFEEEGVITANAEVPQTSMLVYPNPASNQIQIEANAPIESVDVYTMQGIQIIRNQGNNSNTMSVDINDLSPGIFTLRIKSADQYTSRQFVKVE